LKKVLVLGAGRIAGPCIQYLLAQDGYEVYVSDIDEANVRRCIGGKSNGHARIGNVMEDLPGTLREISPNAVVCLLPAAFMAQAAKACLEARVDYVNPSYIKPEIKALDADAKKNGVTLLCELGLDPGIDHMSAAKTIDQIHAQGGRVVSFKSWCGALPAPKDNNNPVGYKISWAPASLIGASKREARIIRDGKTIVWPDGETYRHPGLIEIKGLGWFEEYANADSTPYIEKYGIPEASEIYRGTLRYTGWCEMICKMQDLGLYESGEHDFSGMTYADVTRKLIGAPKDAPLKEALCSYLRLDPYSAVIMKLEWLGMLDQRPVPIQKGTMSRFVECMYAEKLGFAEGEQDLSVMEHRYVVKYKDRSVVRRSTLIDYGTPDGDFSIARLTGLPPAIGAKLILEGRITSKGVVAPTLPEVYEPELAELEKHGVRFTEREEEI